MKKKSEPKRANPGVELEQAARDILAHVKGEKAFPTRRFVLPDPIDVKRIREATKMTQAEFARAFCINPRSLQDWEQGCRSPDTTTRAYLSVIARDREAVLKALGTLAG